MQRADTEIQAGKGYRRGKRKWAEGRGVGYNMNAEGETGENYRGHSIRYRRDAANGRRTVIAEDNCTMRKNKIKVVLF
jgi:hypothetical protein